LKKRITHNQTAAAQYRITASIQCWKANFCALASLPKPFPTCQKVESCMIYQSSYCIRILFLTLGNTLFSVLKQQELKQHTFEAFKLILLHRDAAVSGLSKLKKETVL